MCGVVAVLEAACGCGCVCGAGVGVCLGVWVSLGVCVVEMTGCNGGQECGKVMKAVAKANKLGMKKCV